MVWTTAQFLQEVAVTSDNTESADELNMKRTYFLKLSHKFEAPEDYGD